MRKILYILYQPYKWLVFFPLFLLATVFFSALAVLLAVVAGARVGGLAGVWWARTLAFLIPMPITSEGKENIAPGQSYIVVANHQSHFDILVLYGQLGMDIKWVMKQELRKAPALGYACWKLGNIFVDRSDSAAARASLQEARSRIVNGTSAMFFPEGTRSMTGQMGEFKKGAFAMALDLGLPLLPVTVNGAGKVLPPTSLKVFPGRAHMTVHPPIDIAGYSRENIDELIAKTKAIIQSALPE